MGVVLVILALLFILLGAGSWIGITLGLVGCLAMVLYTNYPPEYMMAQVAFSSLNSFVLVCLPGFILMGEFLFRSGTSGDLYAAIAPWVTAIPGRLLHANVLACAMFAAVSGSSVATTATVGTIAVPELAKRGYHIGLVTGSLAGAGTLGLLIPPSLVMILYGIITGTSIGQLYMAGIIPGILAALAFTVFIAALTLFRPRLALPCESYTWRERIRGTVRILPTVALIFLVLGLIYLGVTTVMEAAMIGAVGGFLATLWYRTFSWQVLREAMLGTIKTTSMIVLIIVGASILSSAMGYLRIPMQLSAAIVAAGMPKYAVFIMVCILYIVLGCFIDGASMLLLTLPVIYPLMLELGFDPIWLGVVLVILIEMANVTPPVGFNLFVLRSVSGVPISTIAKWAIPFCGCLMLVIVALVFCPQLALFLPSTMFK